MSQVAIQKCKDYNPEHVEAALTKLLNDLGGIEKYVKNGQKVLLKPNMLSAKAPERGITTHPVVLETMVRIVQAQGAEVWIGDSPSGALKGIKRCWENTGFLEVAEKTGAKLINFEAGGTKQISKNGKTFHFAQSIFEADVVINLPKWKTHGFTLYTGAIKNLYGTLPGFQKARFHKEFPLPKKFSQNLVDIYECIRPALNIMDGILGMSGNGPATGDLRNVGLLVASDDAVALDTVVSNLMGFDSQSIDMIRLAGEQGLGVNQLKRIEILGVQPDQVELNDFNLPSNYYMKFVPEFLVKWIGRFIWVKPRADYEKCTGCQVCAKGCPVQAITMIENHPVMDYSKCINCMCCNESCPENAIYQEMSWLAKHFG